MASLIDFMFAFILFIFYFVIIIFLKGPTEIDRNSQKDMGLSDGDIKDITNAWVDTMTAVQQKMLDSNAYTWSLIHSEFILDSRTVAFFHLNFQYQFFLSP